MNGSALSRRATLYVAICFAWCGCATPRPSPVSPLAAPPRTGVVRPSSIANATLREDVRPVSHWQDDEYIGSSELSETIPAPEPMPSAASLAELESSALIRNPTLRRLQQEASAEWAQTGYVGALPDPTVSTMFFAPPMMFEPDRQVAEVQAMQMVPWLARLDAQERRAQLEAMAAETELQSERLRILGDLRAEWYRLYVLSKQIETTEADQKQLELLMRTANARIVTGDAQPGDVLMATLELSSLQEQLLSYRQQMVAAKAELNRLAGLPATAEIVPPAELDAELPSWSHASLRRAAMESQPELVAARLRTAATRWGMEIARLQRRPDLSFGVGWMAMDAPGSTMPGAGRDSVTLGVTASIPIWHGKYDAMAEEASRTHYAAHASEDEIAQQLDATLLDLWEQAKASRQTIELYETSILPQARQTFEADQQSLANNAVTFDRVIRDYRALLSLELAYHRALGQLATTLARIRQTVGADLSDIPATAPSRPSVDSQDTRLP